jgi:hypothetical protein
LTRRGVSLPERDAARNLANGGAHSRAGREAGQAAGMFTALAVALTSLGLGAAPPAATTATTTAPETTTRVYVPQLGADPAHRAIAVSLSDALLVATKAHARGREVVGQGDLQRLLDVEAAKQAAGCDSTACATELADALGAPEILIGRLGQVGGSWVLSLSRLERDSMQVTAREQLRVDGAPEGLLDNLDGAVRRLYGVPEPSPLPLLGGVTAGAGVVVAALSVLPWLYAADQLEQGKQSAVLEERQQFKQRGELAYFTWMGALVVGAGIAAVGAGIAAVGLVDDATAGAQP